MGERVNKRGSEVDTEVRAEEQALDGFDVDKGIAEESPEI